MERITILREQASVLRLLAGSFDVPAMRDQLLDIAARCEALARTIEQSASGKPRPTFTPRQP
jgi:hypothetical protein